jgi:transcriptional regulator with XRE-family HTH domain
MAISRKTHSRLWNLKPVLVRLGVSQNELARRLRVEAKHVSMLCRGPSLPSWRTARRVAEVLGVSLDELAGFDVENRKRGA